MIQSYIPSIGKHQITGAVASHGEATTPTLAQLQELANVIMDLPSYQLDKTVVSGATLKWVGEALSPVGVSLSEVMPISKASLYRQYQKDDIDTPLKDHLVSLLRIIDKGLHTWEDEEDLREWLHARIENMGNRRPVDLLSLETGRREVELALDRIDYGLYG